MSDKALILNAGSSSLKFRIYESGDDGTWTVSARGQIDGLGSGPKFTARDSGGIVISDYQLPPVIRQPRAVIDVLAGWLQEQYRDSSVVAVGHRVVHGGTKYAQPVVVTPEVIAELRALIPLAPLHQPYDVATIEAVAERLPRVPQVACFDTAFHRGMPAVAQLIALPDEVRATGVQRYGF